MWRSIPAWAGQPYPSSGSCCPYWVYPRVGGATRRARDKTPADLGLSPRGRGNPKSLPLQPTRNRSIPAWAGQPGDAKVLSHRQPVYPRVGGATVTRSSPHPTAAGLSPRGRGNHRVWGLNRRPHRSIPAWAGQPPTPPGRACRTWVYPRVGGATSRVTDLGG